MPALLPPSQPHELPDDLAAFLLAHAAVSARDEQVTREALRDAAERLPTREAHKVAKTVCDVVSPDGRRVLQGIAHG